MLPNSGSGRRRVGAEGDGALGLGLGLGLDVDDNLGAGDLGLDRLLEPVADDVGVGHGHGARDDEVELDECGAAGVAGADVVGLQRAAAVGLDAGADYYLAKSSFHDDALLRAVVDLIGDAA